MILFLNFDGVLHGNECLPDDLFKCLPRLKKLIDQYPEVEIVITSPWRYYQSLERLKRYFPESMQSRIIGMTPFDEENPASVEVGYDRGEEIEAYLQQNHLTARAWVALDDLLWAYPRHQEQVVKTLSSVGITEQTVEELRTIFERFGARRVQSNQEPEEKKDETI